MLGIIWDVLAGIFLLTASITIFLLSLLILFVPAIILIILFVDFFEDFFENYCDAKAISEDVSDFAHFITHFSPEGKEYLKQNGKVLEDALEELESLKG